jgi:hypothetical protein
MRRNPSDHPRKKGGLIGFVFLAFFSISEARAAPSLCPILLESSPAISAPPDGVAIPKLDRLQKQVERYGYDHAFYLERRDYFLSHPSDILILSDRLEEKLAYVAAMTSPYDPSAKKFYDFILEGNDWSKKLRLLRVVSKSKLFYRNSPYSLKTLMAELELLRSGSRLSVFDWFRGGSEARIAKAKAGLIANVTQTLARRGVRKNLESFGLLAANNTGEVIRTVLKDPRTRFAIELALNTYSAVSFSLGRQARLLLGGKLPPFRFYKIPDQVLEDLLDGPLTPERADQIIAEYLPTWTRQSLFDSVSSTVGIVSGAVIVGTSLWDHHQHSVKRKNAEAIAGANLAREISQRIDGEIARDSLQLVKIKDETTGEELFERWLEDFRKAHGKDADTAVTAVRRARERYRELDREIRGPD